MSGQNPLLRIGITCAAIVIGSAIVGLQLSTGNLSQVVPIVADEEDAATLEDDTYAGSGDEVVDEDGESQAEDDTEGAEEILAESADEDGEDLAEVTNEEPAQEPLANEGETAPEGQASDPGGEKSTDEGSDEGEDSWIIGPSSGL